MGIPYGQDDDRRRTRRIPLTVPVRFDWKGGSYRGKTEDLNRNGALVLSPVTCPAGTVLEITNLHNQRRAEFRVVWAWFGEAGGSGRFKLGLEAVAPVDDFWGLDYAAPRDV